MYEGRSIKRIFVGWNYDIKRVFDIKRVLHATRQKEREREENGIRI